MRPIRSVLTFGSGNRKYYGKQYLVSCLHSLITNLWPSNKIQFCCWHFDEISFHTAPHRGRPLTSVILSNNLRVIDGGWGIQLIPFLSEMMKGSPFCCFHITKSHSFSWFYKRLSIFLILCKKDHQFPETEPLFYVLPIVLNLIVHVCSSFLILIHIWVRLVCTKGVQTSSNFQPAQFQINRFQPLNPIQTE